MAINPCGMYLMSVTKLGSQIYTVNFGNQQTMESSMKKLEEQVSKINESPTTLEKFDPKCLHKIVSNGSMSSEIENQSQTRISNPSSTQSIESIKMSSVSSLKKSHSVHTKKFNLNPNKNIIAGLKHAGESSKS